MLKLVHILPEVAVVFAIVGAILFTGLVFRNPFRSKWLQRDLMSVAAALGIAAAVCFGAGTMIAGAVAAGFGVAAAIVMTIVAFGVAGYAIVRGFDIGERLRRADTGQSPFYPHSGLEALRRLWHPHSKPPAGA
jgi:hypothetical protein